MASTRKIDGKVYKLTLSGNVSGTKKQAEIVAKRLRKAGYSARIVKTKKVSGRAKNKAGKTTKVIKHTRHDVYYR